MSNWRALDRVRAFRKAERLTLDMKVSVEGTTLNQEKHLINMMNFKLARMYMPIM